MELNLDDKSQQFTNIPKVPSIKRLSDSHQNKKSEIIEIKNPEKSKSMESNNFSHIISPQDYESLFKFRQNTDQHTLAYENLYINLFSFIIQHR